ncbi:MAG: hypothetical protein GPJ54_20045 [Candidatus Heimdallarchaeota archaeon]|nr:hypothetical protein [Candidatus Heimdallarchaeota archaeon]
MEVACIAHRGASGVAPENTMLAFWTAISSGTDMIELDVQIAKDKKTVIFHDRSLTRITGEDSGIADFTSQELRKKDVGTWMDKKFSDIRLPSFNQVLQELPKNTSFVVEVKPQNREIEEDRLLERLILENLDDNRSHLGVGTGYISVRDEATLQWFRDNSSKYSVGLMQKKRTIEEFLTIVKDYTVEFSQIRWRNFTEKDFIELKETGTKTIVYYADSPKEWDYLITQKVNGILTNYPSLLSGYLKSKHLKQK